MATRTRNDSKLQRAIALHQQGKSDEAEKLYREVLSKSPTQPDALHLLGVIAHQKGRSEEGVELITQALRWQPQDAAFHSNIAIALRALKRLDEAEAHLRQAIALAPEHVGARRNLAIVLQDLGRLEEAGEQCEILLKRYPNDLAGLRTLGAVRYHQKRLDDSVRAFESALKLDGNDQNVLNNLSILYRELGRFDDSEKCLQKLPRSAGGPLTNLALLRHAQGRWKDALDQFDAALRLQPNDVQALNGKSITLKKLGRLDEAERVLRRAREIDPNDPAPMVNLGDILSILKRADEALPLLEEAVRKLPNSVEARNNLATTLNALDRAKEAKLHLERALELDPNYIPALNNMANAVIAEGKSAEGAVLFQRILALSPNDIPAHYGLATSTSHRFEDADVERMKSLQAKPDTLPDDRELLHFALAHTLDRAGRADEAFPHALTANAMHKKVMQRRGYAFDRQRHLAMIDGLIELFHHKAMGELPSSGLDTELPIFVTGMPRSGTTLIEQILSSHPKVHGADELNDFPRMVADLPGFLGDASPYPDCLRRSTPARIRELAEKQLNRLRELGGAAERVVDKMTINFLHLGLIGMLFPKAKVILCRRDFRDTCLSCFMHNFGSPGLSFTFDLDDLAFYYRQYQRITDHWLRVRPVAIMEVPYEEMVADQEKWTRDLIAFAGLEWDDRCLEFHRNKRKVKTASAQQVRQPIYTKSVGRWKPYEEHLKPLVEAIESGVDIPEPVRANEPIDLAQTLQAGIEHHQANRLEPARECYRKILTVNHDHPEALNLLGLIEHQTGNSLAGLELIRRAVSIQPNEAVFHCNLGLILSALKRPTEAIAAFEEGLRLQPGYSIGRKNLSIVLRESKRYDEAIEHLHRVATEMPQDASVHGALGITLLRRRQYDLALKSFLRQRELDPNSPEPHNNIGVVFSETGRYEEAETNFRAALSRRPDHVEARFNLGLTLHHQDRIDEALACFEDVIARKPDHADALSNRGVALETLGRLEESIASQRRAIALRPDALEFKTNLGAALQKFGQVDEALALFEEVLRIDPDHAMANFNRGQARLLRGDYERGWAGYEWRWRRPKVRAREFAVPRWDGSPMPDATILLYAEQGLGDTFQFVRFASLVKERVGRVVVECQEPLVPILSRCRDIDDVVGRGALIGPFDVQAPLMSLPHILGITTDNLPAATPYLAADPKLVQSWHSRLASVGGFKVGIAWQGNPKYTSDRMRSFALDNFGPIAALPGVKLISLQRGFGSEQRDAVKFEMLNLSDDIDTKAGAFMDTAAIIRNLDLVITTDSAIGHLAGALGAPTWLALSSAADWRWMESRTDSPWYPTVRLFRQSTRGDWTPVFQRMADEIAAKIESRTEPTRHFAVTLKPGSLLSRLAALELRPTGESGDLAELREIAASPPFGSTPMRELTRQLRSVHQQVAQIEGELRSLEQRHDFGIAFISLTRSLLSNRMEIEAIERRIDEQFTA